MVLYCPLVCPLGESEERDWRETDFQMKALVRKYPPSGSHATEGRAGKGYRGELPLITLKVQQDDEGRNIKRTKGVFESLFLSGSAIRGKEMSPAGRLLMFRAAWK